MKNNFKTNLFILLSIIQIKESLSLFTLKKEASSIILHSKLSSLFKKPFNTFCLNNKAESEKIINIENHPKKEAIKSLILMHYWKNLAIKSASANIKLANQISPGKFDNLKFSDAYRIYIYNEENNLALKQSLFDILKFWPDKISIDAKLFNSDDELMIDFINKFNGDNPPFLAEFRNYAPEKNNKK